MNLPGKGKFNRFCRQTSDRWGQDSLWREGKVEGKSWGLMAEIGERLGVLWKPSAAEAP